jgi:hypothetical protein
MELRALINPSLPKLAWVTQVDRASKIVTLQHGSSVEVRQKFFIEGVWNGGFEEGDFRETDCVFGSGGILNHDSIRFVTSASTTDHLYYAETAGQIMVSNSLPLLLGAVQDSLDPGCKEYPQICDSIMDGINDYRRDIPTKRGAVRRLMYRNLDISAETVSESDKRMPPRFTCFGDYKNYRRDNYALIAANARDSARTQALEIWSTQSKGYDSTAINAMAHTFGIDKVFTVSKGKSIYHLAHNDDDQQSDDDGSEICERLGLNHVRIDRRAFAEQCDEEYLYYCARHHNQDMNLKEMSKYVSKAGLLLTGVHGEILCSNDRFVAPPMLDSALRRLDIAGHGMGEIRLVVGFIQVPVSYMGARRKKDIVQITESSEMDPWRLGNAYDRPIARRIAEEAGIPRHLFGQSKHASAVIFSQPSIPHGKTLRREFFDYLVSEKLMPRCKIVFWPVVRFVNAIILLKSQKRYAVVHYAERAISKLTGRKFRWKRMWTQLDGALFCFCVNRTAQSYLPNGFRVEQPSQKPMAKCLTVYPDPCIALPTHSKVAHQES